MQSCSYLRYRFDYGPDSSTNKEQSDAQAEIRRLQKELKRVTDERDILKKAAAYFAKLSD
jgi:transposase